MHNTNREIVVLPEFEESSNSGLGGEDNSLSLLAVGGLREGEPVIDPGGVNTITGSSFTCIPANESSVSTE